MDYLSKDLRARVENSIYLPKMQLLAPRMLALCSDYNQKYRLVPDHDGKAGQVRRERSLVGFNTRA